MKDGIIPRGNKGVELSTCSNSSSSDESDTELSSLCAIVDVSKSEDDSEAVEGAYSCFRGEEERLGLIFPGVNTGGGA